MALCGPSMVFTNIYNPRAALRKMDQVCPTLVKHGATIGANATIVCGVTLGRYAFIGAGRSSHGIYRITRWQLETRRGASDGSVSVAKDFLQTLHVPLAVKNTVIQATASQPE